LKAEWSEARGGLLWSAGERSQAVFEPVFVEKAIVGEKHAITTVTDCAGSKAPPADAETSRPDEQRNTMSKGVPELEIFPELEAEERSVLQRKGDCKLAPKTKWKTGRLFLTEKRLFFVHNGQFVLNVPYRKVLDMRVRQRFLALRRRKVLALACTDAALPTAGEPLKLWLAVRDVCSLAEWLFRMAARPIGPETAEEIVSQVGKKGETLIRKLGANRHATTRELAESLGAKRNVDAVRQAEKEINGVARRVIGRDLMAFRRWWFDPETGRSVRNSWWLTSFGDSIWAARNRAA